MDKKSHHLWSLLRDKESGALKAVRSRQEPESFDEEGKMDKSASVKKEAKDLFKLYWGLVGANLVNDTFTTKVKIPQKYVASLNEKAKGKTSAKKVVSWSELSEKYSAETIKTIRESISEGMKIRIASLNYDIPFIAAADVVFGIEDADSAKVAEAFTLIRENRREEAESKFGSLAASLTKIYDDASQGFSKLSVDDAAKDYWEAYYGPYGKTLVSDVKKRVKADLFTAKLTKAGVDSAAAEYWSNYYDGEYGKLLVRDDIKKN